jgi:Spy/CpxP family protein refolding chaperone
LARCYGGRCGFGPVGDAFQTSQPFASTSGRRRHYRFNQRRYRAVVSRSGFIVPFVDVADNLVARSAELASMMPCIFRLLTLKPIQNTSIMKLITFIALLTTAGTLSAADKSAAPDDPLAGAFFPPEVVLLARDVIGLTPEQRETFRACVEKTQPRSDELRKKLERETASLSMLAKKERLDEAALVAQLDRVLDSERELKHLQIGLLVAIKNLLTPEQQTKLSAIAKDGGKQLAEDTRKRLSEKVEHVTEDMQKWAASGRDPSAVGKTMQEKFKPLIEAGKVIEAEAVLDRLLEQINQPAK